MAFLDLGQIQEIHFDKFHLSERNIHLQSYVCVLQLVIKHNLTPNTKQKNSTS